MMENLPRLRLAALRGFFCLTPLTPKFEYRGNNDAVEITGHCRHSGVSHSVWGNLFRMGFTVQVCP